MACVMGTNFALTQATMMAAYMANSIVMCKIFQYVFYHATVGKHRQCPEFIVVKDCNSYKVEVSPLSYFRKVVQYKTISFVQHTLPTMSNNIMSNCSICLSLLSIEFNAFLLDCPNMSSTELAWNTVTCRLSHHFFPRVIITNEMWGKIEEARQLVRQEHTYSCFCLMPRIITACSRFTEHYFDVNNVVVLVWNLNHLFM